MYLPSILADQNAWWRDPAARTAPVTERRDFQRSLVERVREGGRRAVVVLGPRQVGKTVALRQVADDLLDEGWPPGNVVYFDFSDDRLLAEVSPREIAEIEPPGLVHERPRLLLLDEIHRAKRWEEWLKLAVDSERGWRVIATGSAADAIRTGSRESGQGRWDEMRVGGLTFAEHVRILAVGRRVDAQTYLRQQPDELRRYLQLGGFPEHVTELNLRQARERIRTDIADRAIARDLARTGVDVEGVRRLFVYLATQSGGIFSARERARDLSVDERSVKGWVDHLLDAQLVTRLEQHARGSKRLRSKPKLYAADHGLVSAFAAAPDPRADAEVFGRIVETAVFRHLREAFSGGAEDLCYFRDDDDREGDFVIRAGSEPVVLEVTTSPDIRSDKLARLRDVGKVLRLPRLVLAYAGYHRVRRGDVDVVPLDHLLLHPEGLGSRT